MLISHNKHMNKQRLENKSGKELLRFIRNGKLPRMNGWVRGEQLSVTGTTNISIVSVLKGI